MCQIAKNDTVIINTSFLRVNQVKLEVNQALCDHNFFVC